LQNRRKQKKEKQVKKKTS
jgi:hypothetical protein